MRLLNTSLVALLTLSLVMGCGKKTETITGKASAGPISGATITVYKVGADGTRGSKLGTATTDAKGNFSVAIDKTTGSVEVVADGGEYKDEATKKTRKNTSLSGVYTKNQRGKGKALGVNTVTHAATVKAKKKLNTKSKKIVGYTRNATLYATEDESIDATVESAIKETLDFFGLPATVDLMTAPDEDGVVDDASSDEDKILLLLAAQSQQAERLGTSANNLADGLATECAEGTEVTIKKVDADGNDTTETVDVPETEDLDTDLNNYLASSDNDTGTSSVASDFIAPDSTPEEVAEE